MAQKRKLIVSIMLAVVLAVLGSVMAACGEKVFTVTFDSNGGSAVESVKVNEGKLLEKPADPTRDTYDFLGWLDEEGNAFDFESTKITKNITLKASWALKKYTVTFNTNGGTEINPVTIEHGSLVQRPEDPVKTGEVFLGWYADSAFKTPYDFATEITEAKTIYARFAAEVDEVYTARLMDGNVELDPVQTNAAGMLVNLPNGSGENFIGWWISDSQDAEKLTCQYVDQVLTQNITLYAVYEGAGVAVSVNATGVSWTSKGANRSYTVTITPPEGDAINSTVSTLNFPYNFADKPAGEYVVTVTFNGETTTVYYNNKALSRVSLFSVEGFVLTFNKVANATNYSLAIDCGHSEHVNDVHELGDTNTYDFTACEMKEDGIKFVVTASAEGYMSSVSEEYVVLRTLEQATGFFVDSATEEVTWDAVEGAERYFVQINDEEGYFVTDTRTATLKNYAPGSIVVKVTAYAKGYNASEVAVFDYDKLTLLVPQNVKVLDTIVTWDAVAGAASYVVRVNGDEFPVSGTEFTVPADTDISRDVLISVKAVSADGSTDSLYSEEKKLTTTLEGQVSYENGKVKWNNVFGITKYAVRINGGQETVVEGANELAIEFNGRGTNTISVCFYDKQGAQSAWESIDVKVFTVALMYNNVQNNSQFMSFYRAQGDELKIPSTTPTLAGYEFKFWSAVSNSDGEEFTALTLEDAADLVLYAQWQTGSVAVLLDANGGEVEEASMGIRYLESFQLPIPTGHEDGAMGFEGWYTGRNGDGERMTDASGVSVKPWQYNQPMTLYANWVEVLKFSLVNNNQAYEVSAGANISKVTNVTVPAVYNSIKVSNLAANAFSNCSKLLVLNIPDSLEFIEFGMGGKGTGSAFTGCSRLESINVYDASNIVKEQYEKKFASYEGVLFYNNEYTGVELKYYPESRRGDYEIPYGTEIIPYNVLNNYTNLAKITIPASVTNIYESFARSSITEVVFLEKPENPQDLLGFFTEDDLAKEPAVELGGNAFYTCYELKTVTLPTHLKNFDATAFGFPQSPSRTFKFESVSINDGPSDYSVVDGMLTNYAKTEILFCPFGRTGEITIPSGIDTIGEYAFQHCRYIVKLTVPGWVKEIKKGAFAECVNLTVIDFQGKKGDAELYIRENAFFHCYNVSGATVQGGGGLKSVTLSSNVVYVGTGAFGSMNNLQTVNLNTDGQEVVFEKNAFCKSDSVCSVLVINIGPKAYVEGIANVFGTKVKTINLDPANPYYEMGKVDKDTGNGVDNDVLYNIGQTAIIFVPMEKEGVYYVPSTVTKIDAKTFLSRSKLIKVTITWNVTSIGDSAFEGAYSLALISFLDVDPNASGDDGGRAGKQPLTIGNRAFANTGLTGPRMTSRLVSIGDYAFESCAALQYIQFNNDKDGTLNNCTSIGKGAFNNCPAFQILYLPANIEVIGSSENDNIDIFEGTGNLETIEINQPDQCAKFAVVDNILYAKDDNGNLTKLMYCPLKNAVAGGKVVVPATVTKICDKAFQGNISVKEVDFSQLTQPCQFGSNVFTECKGIERIVLPQGITSIAYMMFYNCYGLKYIFIPKTVTQIEQYAFYNCSALETVEFEDGGEAELCLPENNKLMFEGNELMGAIGAFVGCTSLKELNLPARLKNIPGGSFVGLYATKVTFGSKVYESNERSGNFTIANDSQLTTIGAAAFYGAMIEEIVFPASLQELALGGDPKDPRAPAFGKHFYGCSKLHTVTFTNGCSIPAIPENAFYGCSALTEIDLPATVTDIGASAFELSGITSIDIAKCTNLASIGDKAFKTAALESISIPANVTYIGEEAFAYNYDLATIAIADGNLQTIGKGAFKFTDIAKFVFPITAGQITLAEDIFYGCAKLNEVVLNEKVVSGIEGAFNGTAISKFTMSGDNKSYVVDTVMSGAVTDTNGRNVYYYHKYSEVGEEIIIPEGVVAISPKAFASKNITKVTLPSTLTTIGDFAFSKCTNLREVVFTGDTESVLQKIGEGTFQGCTALVKISVNGGEVNTFPNRSMELGNYLFNGCTALKTFTIPAAITSLPEYMFRGCKSIENVVVPRGVAYGVGMFQDCAFTTYTVDRAISSYMFDGCTNLASIVGSYTSIGNYAFRNTAFTSIDLSNVSSLGQYAFYHCENLLTVTVKNTNTYAFAECHNLQTVYLKGTTSIMNYAFYNCTSLREINEYKAPSGDEREGEAVGARIVSTFPSNITSMGTYAFSNTALEEVIMPQGMTNLNVEGLFKGCANLEKVILPKSFSQLGKYFFQYCSNLGVINYAGYTGDDTLALPSNCTSFGYSVFEETAITVAKIKSTGSAPWYLFKNCKELVYAELLPGTKATASEMFYGCSKLETLILPNGMTRSWGATQIGSKIAMNCVSLKKVVFGNANLFSTACFYGCTSLEEVVLPSDTIQVEHLAFAYTGIKEIMIPASMDGTKYINSETKFMDQSAFYGCNQLTNIACADDSSVYQSRDGVLYLKDPDVVWIYPAGKEGAVAFFNEDDKFADLDKTVKVGAASTAGANIYVIAMAFSGDQFVDIVVPEGVQEIKGQLFSSGNEYFGTFAGMHKIKSVTLPSTLKTIGGYAFRDCTSLESIVIPEGVTSIGYSAFMGCTSLKSVTLPSTLEDIGGSAFINCTSLETVNLPNGLRQIGAKAFANTALKSIAIPESILEFAPINGERGADYRSDMAIFENCTQLTEVILHDKLLGIGAGMFRGCSALKSINIPASLLYYGDGLFNGTGITEITIPASMTKGNENWAGLIAGNTAITKVIIPEGIYKIPAYAFDGCTALTTVVLPSTLRVIGEGAFRGCTALTSSIFANGVIPANIKLIERYAFEGCTAMTNIYVQANTIVGVGVFSGWTDKQTVNFVDGEAKVNAIALVEGVWQCGQEWCSGTVFTEQKGELVCANCGYNQRVLAGDSDYDSYRTGCNARLVFGASLPESDER